MAATGRDGQRSPSRTSGFTLIELLVVIAIIGALVALLLPALARCTFLSRRARELSAAQQLMVAFTVYADDHKGAVLPGYPTASMVNGPMEVLDDEGERVWGPEAQRYPWRLAPYLDYNFKGLYKDERLLTEIKDNEPIYKTLGVDYRYVVSLYPSLGMNVAFVGGSEKFLAFNPSSQQVFGKFYTTRIDEPRRPAELIVFASARAEEAVWASKLGPPEGFFRVEPPSFGAPAWEDVYDPATKNPGANSGFVSLRWGGTAVAAMFDGHAAALNWDQLRDMRRWADAADASDWVLEPK